MGKIVADALIVNGQGASARYPITASTDYDAYDDMERDAHNRDRKDISEGTIFHTSSRGSRPNASVFFKFFMFLGAFGLLLWAVSKIVTYYSLWMPTLGDYDNDYFKYSQAMERYVEFLFAADAWGLFLAIVAIIGILTLIINELSHQKRD